jgi:ferric iron reductase protein FhuF
MISSISLSSILGELKSKGLYIPLTMEEDEQPQQTLPIKDLFEESRIKSLIEQIAISMGTDNLAAAASLFQKRYSSYLLASVLTPMLTVDVGILANADSTEMVMENGLPAGIYLNDSKQAIRIQSLEDRRKVFKAVFDDNLGRMIYLLASNFHISPLILWGNIGNYVGYVKDQYNKGHIPNRPMAEETIEALLNGVDFEGPPLNTTYEMVELEELGCEKVRVRNSCCLWYVFPGNKPCTTCPRLSDSERAEAIAEYMVKK